MSRRRLRFFHPAFFLFIVLAAAPAHGQQVEEAPLLTRRLTAGSINYLGVAVSHERRLGERTTVLAGAGAHYSFYGTSYPTLGTRFINVIDRNFGRDYSTAGVTPYAFFEARLYPNLRQRLTRGRDIRHNAGTYAALFGEVPFATGTLINVANLELAYPVGVKLGVRRNLGEHLLGEGSAALVSLLSQRQRSVGPRLDVSLAWVFAH